MTSVATSHHGQHSSCSKPEQQVTGKDILNRAFFMSHEEWETARNSKSFDYVIIGSSFCALAFIDRVLQNNPNAKCIILERGDYIHPDHLQNMSPVHMKTLGGLAESFPWSLTEETHNNGQWVHGMYNFFGGRSIFWSGWCPEPTNDEMEGWPSEVIETVHDYFPAATDLLNVVPADKIFDKEEHTKPIFGLLQDTMNKILADTPNKINTITRVCPAPLAVASQYRLALIVHLRPNRNEGYRKFSVQEKLLHLAHPTHLAHTPPRLMIECLVTKINHDGLMATELETNRGTFALGRAKLILAMGSLPPTTLVLNSFLVNEFPLLKNIGMRFTGHIISSVIARVPREDVLAQGWQLADLELAANYIAGIDKRSRHQFHIQLSTVTDSNPLKNRFDAFRHMPDIVASPSFDQLSTSKEHVLLVCACIGQLDHDNSKNWLQKNDGENLATNVNLQVVINDIDNDLWDTMDSTIFEVLEKVIDSNNIQYWHDNTHRSTEALVVESWKKTRPLKEKIRCPAVVHEASTMWIGSDHEAPVGLDYRLKGVDNVYVTGGSLWPTGASWNPTAVMTALAIHLADQELTAQLNGVKNILRKLYRKSLD